VLLAEVVASAMKFKADIVTRDEKESGIRALLNFGHTIGHAVEAYRYDSLLHGECVAIGRWSAVVVCCFCFVLFFCFVFW
jgi:3-dehydroquinate synthase